MRARVTKTLLLSLIIGGVAIATTTTVVAATETIDIPTHNNYDNNDVSSSHSAPQDVVPQLNAHEERTLLRDPKTVIQKAAAANDSLRRQEVASALDDISVQHALDDIAVRSLEDSIADSIAANTALALVTEVEDSSIIESLESPAESQFLRRTVVDSHQQITTPQQEDRTLQLQTTNNNSNNDDDFCAKHPIESCASHTVQYNHQTINCCTCTRAVPTVQTVCVVGLRKFTEVYDLCSMDCLGGGGDEEG